MDETKISIDDPDYRPDKFSLSNGEIRATGVLGQGAVLNIARELLAARKQLAALSWKKITPENLPKVGDEVYRGLRLTRPRVAPVLEGHIATRPCAFHWRDFGFSHFRSLNPPEADRD
jgi:hypothetical protein